MTCGTGSVAGWTSWYAFLDRVTERDVEGAADVLHDVLAPFGYDLPPDRRRLRTGPDRHAGPLAASERQVPVRARRRWSGTSPRAVSRRASGPMPVSPTARMCSLIRRNSSPTADGTPAYGNWVGYVMDASNSGHAATIWCGRCTTRWPGMGWRYYKLDALRHLRYEGYNSHADYFRARGLDRDEVFRRFVQTVRDAIGRQAFLLACWGIRPELIGHRGRRARRHRRLRLRWIRRVQLLQQRRLA